ncbi:hypothetical protein BD410DRAFT_531912 [Rickenella mellea]|uniref:DUF7079 domain-containing protein n=1 Tax=Rickenella mellea TaxID=50990 RepID=A0A4Y7QGA1_9AGAM|nr:hypothetical protein BD410DRAFT_531912 [Rickenella mellea]
MYAKKGACHFTHLTHLRHRLATMTLTEQEKTAYIELSVTFLDRAMSKSEANLIARNISELDFTIPELEHMLRYNVSPILYTNFLYTVNGWHLTKNRYFEISGQGRIVCCGCP